MERNIIDGDNKIGPTPKVRLVRSIVAFAIVGLVVDYRALSSSSLAVRIGAFAATIFLGLLSWIYLEIRNHVIAVRDEKNSFGMNVATIAIHPAMIPVYFIVIPIVVYLTYAWFKNSSADQDAHRIPTNYPASMDQYNHKKPNKPRHDNPS
jgi:hypothetical protein